MIKNKTSPTSQTLRKRRYRRCSRSVIDSKTVLPLSRYLERVDQHLGKLTCGLLNRADLDHKWRAAWSSQVEPEQAVELALSAEGFMVSQLPTALMRQLASERHSKTHTTE